MADPRFPVSRRRLLAGLLACLAVPRGALAFGQEGAFHPRLLRTTGTRVTGPRELAPGRWAWELVRRTSAPARLVASHVAADDRRLLAEPFAIWAGDGDVPPLSGPELRGLERFIQLGGVLLVDDSDPASGAFGRAARRELRRVMPQSSVVRLQARAGEAGATEHVIYKSYYLLDGPVGRVQGPPHAEAIVRGRNAQVIFLSHDLLGALAREPDGTWALPIEGGGSQQRQHAVRFAVNLAMYVLCSNYKDDQVHARALMRRRGRWQ